MIQSHDDIEPLKSFDDLAGGLHEGGKEDRREQKAGGQGRLRQGIGGPRDHELARIGHEKRGRHGYVLLRIWNKTFKTFSGRCWNYFGALGFRDMDAVAGREWGRPEAPRSSTKRANENRRGSCGEALPASGTLDWRVRVT